MRAILTYHSIDPSGSVISTSETALQQHVEWLASGAVRVAPLERLNAQPADQDAVALTFDDAFANFETTAWPLLRDHGLTATVFVVTDHAGGSNAWERHASHVPDLPLLTWEALGRLAEEGVSLGSHTRTHPDLRTLTPDRLDEEVAGSADRMQAETGIVPSSFAYPYGGVSVRAASVVADTYAWGCTTDFRPLGRDESHARLPRLDAYYFRRPGLLATWGSARFRRYVRLRALGRRVRRSIMGEPSTGVRGRGT